MSRIELLDRALKYGTQSDPAIRAWNGWLMTQAFCVAMGPMMRVVQEKFAEPEAWPIPPGPAAQEKFDGYRRSLTASRKRAELDLAKTIPMPSTGWNGVVITKPRPEKGQVWALAEPIVKLAIAMRVLSWRYVESDRAPLFGGFSGTNLLLVAKPAIWEKK